MTRSESIAWQFNNMELALESLELHLLQAIWGLEHAVQTQIESNTKLQKQICELIYKFESDRPHFETKNNAIR